ncbi:MAG: cupredoxin domain-containing protein [Acidimicrobiia bacterium]|nr:cupredoxin domain-containing protein [Acidimicrobiia bacterium]
MRPIAALAALVLVLAACGDDDAATTTTDAATTTTDAATTTAGSGGGTASIVIEGFDFGDPITIEAGTEVVVTNADGAPHTFTSDDGLWDSGTITDGEYRRTFDDPGTYAFHCEIHPSMQGELTVTG